MLGPFELMAEVLAAGDHGETVNYWIRRTGERLEDVRVILSSPVRDVTSIGQPILVGQQTGQVARHALVGGDGLEVEPSTGDLLERQTGEWLRIEGRPTLSGRRDTWRFEAVPDTRGGR